MTTKHTFYLRHSAYPDGTLRGLEKWMRVGETFGGVTLFDNPEDPQSWIDRNPAVPMRVVRVTLETPAVRQPPDAIADLTPAEMLDEKRKWLRTVVLGPWTPYARSRHSRDRIAKIRAKSLNTRAALVRSVPQIDGDVSVIIVHVRAWPKEPDRTRFQLDEHREYREAVAHFKANRSECGRHPWTWQVEGSASRQYTSTDLEAATAADAWARAQGWILVGDLTPTEETP